MSRSALRVVFVLFASVPVAALLVAAPTAWATTESVPTVTHTVAGSVVRTADLRLPAPAARLAAYWRGAPEARVTLAFSPDGRTFSPAVDAGRDEVGEQRGNGITYGSVQVSSGARVVRVTSDRPLARVWVDGMADGARVVKRVRTERAAAAAVAQPPVLSRADWKADESLRYQAGGTTLKEAPTYHASKKLIVHHTDTTNADPDPAATIRAIYRYHVGTQGWADIGYNFFVDEAGRTYEGRWSRSYAGTYPSGDDELGRGVTGSHTGGWNSGTVGVALLGSLMNQDATPAARSGLVDVLAWLSEKNGLDPKATSTFTNPVSGAQKTTPNIAGHRDYLATLCPGDRFHATLPALRQSVADRMGGVVADTAAPSAPVTLSLAPGSRAVTATWSAAADDRAVTGYEVFRSTSSTGTYALVATTAGTSYADKGLKTGRTYWYRVRAYDAAGNRSAFSPTASATAR